jgi:hypothetical protein
VAVLVEAATLVAEALAAVGKSHGLHG